MISHKFVLMSLFLGAIQGAYPSLWLAKEMGATGLDRVLIFFLGFCVGVVLAFIELSLWKRWTHHR